MELFNVGLFADEVCLNTRLLLTSFHCCTSWPEAATVTPLSVYALVFPLSHTFILEATPPGAPEDAYIAKS